MKNERGGERQGGVEIKRLLPWCKEDCWCFLKVLILFLWNFYRFGLHITLLGREQPKLPHWHPEKVGNSEQRPCCTRWAPALPRRALPHTFQISPTFLSHCYWQLWFYFHVYTYMILFISIKSRNHERTMWHMSFWDCLNSLNMSFSTDMFSCKLHNFILCVWKNPLCI